MNNMSACPDQDGQLSPEADNFLKDALAEFAVKQDSLNQSWHWDDCISWSFDISAAKLFLEIEARGRIEADGFLIGTYCPSDQSFEWAWNNPRYDCFARSKSLQVRELGVRLRISYLATGIVPAPGMKYVSYLGAIAIKTTGSDGLFCSGEGDVQPLIVVSNIKRTRH